METADVIVIGSGQGGYIRKEKPISKSRVRGKSHTATSAAGASGEG